MSDTGTNQEQHVPETASNTSDEVLVYEADEVKGQEKPAPEPEMTEAQQPVRVTVWAWIIIAALAALLLIGYFLMR